jgi:hypothetical protein
VTGRCLSLGAGSGLRLKPSDPEQAGAGELKAEVAGRLSLLAPEPGAAPCPAPGELLPGAAIRVSRAAPGSATATAPAATTLARTTDVATEPTLAGPSSRAATRWRSSFIVELWFMGDTHGEVRRPS